MLSPDQYDPRRAKALLEFLMEEIRRAKSDRNQKEADWIRWAKAYRARPAQDRKTFPFLGASNIVLPVVATDVDTLFARMMGLLFEPQNIWTVQAKRPELADVAPRVQEFLEWAQENELSLAAPIGDWILEIHKLGTGILKQRYHREMKKVYEWRELDQGTWQAQNVIMLKDSPEVRHVPLHDFYVPPGFKSLQEMPWCAERIRLTWQQYTNRVNAGVYQGNDQLSRWFDSRNTSKVQQVYDEISHFRESLGRRIEPYEFWTDFDIDGDGYDEALVCTIHEESATYLRLDLNPFFNQDKPYSVGRFMRDGNSFYGIGLSEMLDHFQEEGTALHNQRLDAGTIANTQMYAVTKDNKNIADDEPIFNGKIWKVNKTDDIKPLAMGSTFPGQSIQSEQQMFSYAQRRTGVNDYVLGQQGPEIGYGTAYTTQQMLMNSSKRFGQTLREIHEPLNETGTRVLELYQQFNQRGKEFIALGQEDGSLVHTVLQFPLDLIRRGFKVSVTAITAETSKDSQIRTNVVIMQQLMQFYQQYMMALQYLMNPQLPPPMQQVIMQMIEGMTTLMRRLLDLYGIQDSEKMIPELNSAMNAYQQQLAQLQQIVAQPPGGGLLPPGPAGGAPGMGGFQQAPGSGVGASGFAPPQGGGLPGSMPGAGGFGLPGSNGRYGAGAFAGPSSY